MWLHHRTFPDSPAYNVCLLVRMSGPLDTGALRQALRQLIRRHAVLRTVYAEREDGTVQIVTDDDSLGLAPVPCDDAEARAAELAATPFALRDERPIRLELLRLDDEEHALVLVVHHIAWDGMTWGSLSRDLSALYRAAVSGEPDGLPPLDVQYADYAEWEQRRPFPRTTSRTGGHGSTRRPRRSTCPPTIRAAPSCPSAVAAARGCSTTR
ncbi:condensation domain-containing protein [Actinomadura madurae]|nr:condensation domain-containing protein [Actinomadura madurae]MCP9976345.1 condensation domain-containing protein [Actinomadura madurae]